MSAEPSVSPADQSRRMESLLRLGTVAAVDHQAARVRVKTGGLTTDWLPWFERRAGSTRDWDPPTEGEQCLVLSPSGEPAGGVVLLGIFSDASPPPSDSPDKHTRVYPDGAKITYDHASGHLSATGIQSFLIESSGPGVVDCPATTFTGQVIVEGLLTYKAGVDGADGSAGNTISGPLTQSGGDLSSNGIVLHTHQHSGIEPGPETTGGPV